MEFEEGSGLYYYRLRYYDPEAGRFISRDPLGMWGDPGQRGNAQNYCGNNPVNRVDPMGLAGAAEVEAQLGAWLNDSSNGASPAYDAMYNAYNGIAKMREGPNGVVSGTLQVDGATGAIRTGGYIGADKVKADEDQAFWDGYAEGRDDGAVSLASDLTFGLAYGEEAARARDYYKLHYSGLSKVWRASSWATSFAIHMLAFQAVTAGAAARATGAVATGSLEAGTVGSTTWAGKSVVEAGLTGLPRAVVTFHEAVHSVLSPVLARFGIGRSLVAFRTPLLNYLEEFTAQFLALLVRGGGSFASVGAARTTASIAYTSATEYAALDTFRRFGLWSATIVPEAVAYSYGHYFAGESMACAKRDLADYEEAMDE